MSNYIVLIQTYEPENLDLENEPQVELVIKVTIAHSRRAFNDDLTPILKDAGIRYERDGFAAARLVAEVVTILASAGGLSGIATALKAYFSRNKGKSVKFGDNGQVIQADGMSVNDIIRLIEAKDQNKQGARHRIDLGALEVTVDTPQTVESPEERGTDA